MWRTIGLLFLLAACGTNDGQAAQSFSLSSPAFQDGQAMPVQFTCDGANQSPPLSWSEPPQGTRSLTLIVDDPDAPGGTFRHWAAYDIPANARSLAAGQSLGVAGVNDFGKPGYGGPCPPRGRGPHHYRFRLFALNVDRLDVAPGPTIEQVERHARAHLIGSATLTGVYERR
jgi:Raf kinase inhibitor-like YbhB/YbcL family protein